MGAGQNAPVIIKRKKVVAGDGHHGGAWKVAYADFVTAMMAFFMLMWLLNATTEKQRKGIADYFNPTIPVNRISGGGEGAFGGESIFSEEILAQTGSGGTDRHASSQRQSRGQNGVDASDTKSDPAESAALQEQVDQMLRAMGGESMAANNALRHIVTRVTDEGLVVELYDNPGSPLFLEGTAEPTEMTRMIAGLVAEVFALVDNRLAVGAYSRAHPVVLADDPAWDLTTRRAHAMRELVEAAGFPADRVQRVTGFGDNDLVTIDPMAVRNNRVELVLLRAGR
ncbi:flagellar motor protein MotB [Actibacterium sp. XHP0104]|uniref:flagellar motor protein MotB n=1 Tax=Actibacterium sp. XHP0104 TaxID=2984335 RepID=UPI0021E70C78|nr:flagellar motor protein MotB [Actibacterium sp. XHP0104]MCV2881826.1 chemotaxis protein MotB [Actibacterium sp. XHP0104]